MGGFARRATISGRGGTTGLAAGCPARFGFAGGRSGLPPPTGAPSVALVSAAGVPSDGEPGRAPGRGGTGRAGTPPGPRVPGAMLAGGTTIAGGVLGASVTPGGMGCRGPERICPGLGVGGAGRLGITALRFTMPGGDAAPSPLASGGRKGWAARAAAGCGWGSASLCADSVSASGAAGARSILTAGWARAGAGASASISIGVSFGESAAGACPRRRRSSSATSSSRELECVFLSATPSSGNSSRRTFGFTSSSRASSLMRILLIQDAPARTSLRKGCSRYTFLFPNFTPSYWVPAIPCFLS